MPQDRHFGLKEKTAGFINITIKNAATLRKQTARSEIVWYKSERFWLGFKLQEWYFLLEREKILSNDLKHRI